ncbi:MAG: septum formation inhibitor [Oscillospiraceae bacterium]
MAADLNLAYEYENFDMLNEREEEYAENIRRKRSANKRRKNAANIRIIAAAVIVLFLFSFMTYGRVELAKLYSEKTELEAELTLLQNENISLESELAQKTGLTKVEDYAENRLGLQKLDKSQIEYVEIEEQTSAQTVSPDNSNIFVKIRDWFNGALEYLGL